MRRYPDEVERLSQPVDLGPLFQIEVRTLARRTDPATSQAAAVAIADTLSELQSRVYAAFVEHGAMSAKQAEQLPEFADLGFSTVRKRISELAARGWLQSTGLVVDGCMTYEARTL